MHAGVAKVHRLGMLKKCLQVLIYAFMSCDFMPGHPEFKKSIFEPCSPSPLMAPLL